MLCVHTVCSRQPSLTWLVVLVIPALALLILLFLTVLTNLIQLSPHLQ